MPRLTLPLWLAPQEKAELEQLTRCHSAPQCRVQRAHIILLAAEKQTVSAIAQTLQVCTNTVRKWIRRYIPLPPQTRPSAHSPTQSAAALPSPSILGRLADAPRSGRPDIFTAEQFCAIIALACEKPEDHGRPITHWTARELKDQAIQQAIVPTISVRHLNRLLQAVDLQPHRSRYWLNAKPDPQKDDKIRTLCQVYQQALPAAGRGEFTFSVD